MDNRISDKRRTPRSQDLSPDLRLRILRASASVFRQKGFATATVRDIARACGMQPGTLHYRYPTKQALIVDLMRLCMDQITTRVRQATETEQDPLLRIRAGLRAHVGFLVDESDMVNVLLFDWRSLQSEEYGDIVAQRDAYERVWGGFVADLARSGMIRPDVSLNMLRFIGFGAGNWVATWYRSGGPLDSDAIADSIWSVIAFGVVDEPYRNRYLA